MAKNENENEKSFEQKSEQKYGGQDFFTPLCSAQALFRTLSNILDRDFWESN